MRQVPMNVHDFIKKKQQNQKITMMTCYDYPSARIISETEIDCVLVGDSVAMAVHGHPNTLMATIDMMALHTAAVARGIEKQFIVADMPFLCHKGSRKEIIQNVTRLMQAGAHALKIEGADPDTLETIQYLIDAGVPVMGHIGLTPQALHGLGGMRVQGREQVQQQKLSEQAKALEQAGCFALVVECVPSPLSIQIRQNLQIPCIGIGAGPETDGQVLVWHDLLGIQTEFKPKFLKQFGNCKTGIKIAIQDYVREVNEGLFPSAEHCY